MLDHNKIFFKCDMVKTKLSLKHFSWYNLYITAPGKKKIKRNFTAKFHVIIIYGIKNLESRLYANIFLPTKSTIRYY